MAEIDKERRLAGFLGKMFFRPSLLFYPLTIRHPSGTLNPIAWLGIDICPICIEMMQKFRTMQRLRERLITTACHQL